MSLYYLLNDWINIDTPHELGDVIDDA